MARIEPNHGTIGPFCADVFDLRQRKGLRIVPEAHTYEDLADKDLSTCTPETTDGSIRAHANLLSACKLVGKRSREWTDGK